MSNCDVFKRWKLGSINIRSGKEKSEGAKIYCITKEVARAGLSICLLQEVRYRNNGQRIIRLNTGESYEFVWSGPKRRRETGVAFLIKVESGITYSKPDVEDPRLIAMNITVHGFKLRIVNVYSPTDTDGTAQQKDEFYRKVRKSCESLQKNHKLLVCGDFNAITSVVLSNTCYNGTNIVEDKKCNDNGERLKTFCRSNKLCMLQTYVDVPLEDRYTWYSNDNKTKRVLDYILAQRFLQQYTENCTVKKDYEFDSDHKLLVADFRTPCTKRARWKQRIRREVKPDLSALNDGETKDKFIRNVAVQLPTAAEHDAIDKKSECLVNALNAAARSSLPPKTGKCTREIWKDDDELNRILQERSILSRNCEQHKQLTKLIKKRVRHLRNQKMKTEADEINQYANKRQIENLFRAFKDDNHAFKPSSNSSKCDPSKLREYFYEHFKSKSFVPDPDELVNIPRFIRQLKDNAPCHMNVVPPDINEVKSCLNKLKNGKASNDIPSLFLKHASENIEFLTELTRLYKDVWSTLQVPKMWSHSRLISLWKGPLKGKVDDPTAYRGLQIGSTLCKLMVVIIINRIKEWYESQLLDQQQGFRSSRGTTDGIFLTKGLQQITKKAGRKAYLLFVDLTAAFDHIDRKWLFKTIKQRIKNDTDCKLFNILESLYSSTTTALAEHELDAFIIELGVRQGGPESPILFNLFIDYVMRVFLDECKRQKVEFVKLKYTIPKAACTNEAQFGEYGETIIDWIGYADDINIAFKDQSNLEKGARILNTVFKRFKLEINLGKTKTMIFNFNDANLEYPESILSLDGVRIDNVKEFKYLGSKVKFDEPGTGDTEITSRIDMAESKFYEHGKKLMNFKIHLSTRVSILNSIVRSRLTYGCQTWTLTQEQKSRLDAAYLSMLRKMIRGGYARQADSWRFKMTNEKILERCHARTITEFSEGLRRSYLAHVIRLPNTSITKRIAFNSNHLTRPGRPAKTFIQSVLEAEKTNITRFAILAKKKLV